MWWSRRRTRTAVSSHDLAALERVTRRTQLLRVVLVTAALVLVVAAAASARRLDTQEKGLLPNGATGVVVLDLSLSIAEGDYNAVRAALRRLIAENARVGLVVFSDVPYELLPPGTPASQLRPMLRLLVPPRLGNPVTPWSGSFRAGTRISSALELARRMLERDQVRKGAILLVSDLETAPDDVPQLARTVDSLRRSSIALRVFPLAPSSDARRIFGGLLEDSAFAAPLDPNVTPPESKEARSTLPVSLLVLGLLAFGALTLHERFAGRLRLPSAVKAR